MIFHPRKWLEPHFLDAIDILRFELISVKGRFLNSKFGSTDGKEYLQLGSGEDRFEGFLNSNFFSDKHADAHVDARFPLQFKNAVFRGVYAHHVVEHFSYVDAFKLFHEIHRVLKPKGVFRMIVPNLEVFMRLCMDPDPQIRQHIFNLLPPNHMSELQVKTPLEMVDYMFRDQKCNRHLSAWDMETSTVRLIEAGFSEVRQCAVNASLDPMLTNRDKPHWRAFSLYVEAIK